MDDSRCRVCGRCVDVCPFHALRIVDEHIQLDSAVCRGCGLCVGVCPTGALATHAKAEALPPHSIVFACQRRTGSIAGANVVRMRCVGELHAGMLLESEGPIRVAGCAEERCRFGKGAAHAVEAVERARAMGADIVDDWSPDRLHDPLQESWNAGAPTRRNV